MTEKLTHFEYNACNSWDYEPDLILETMEGISKLHPFNEMHNINEDVLYKENNTVIILETNVYDSNYKKIRNFHLVDFGLKLSNKDLPNTVLHEKIFIGLEWCKPHNGVKFKRYINFMFTIDMDECSMEEMDSIKSDWNYLNKIALGLENFLKDNQYFGLIKIK